MGRTRLIRITDISDIDTSRVSVYDMNNRYVDARGNIYGLKYNREQRRVEVIKLMRTHTSAAPEVQKEIVRKKIQDRTYPGNEVQAQEEEGAGEDLYDFFDPDIFIDSLLTMMKTHRDRMKGIAMNIKKSNVIPRENKNDSVILDDLFRNIDIDGIQQMEKLENYQKELTSYPRSITYYQAKLDDHGRAIIDNLAGSTAKIMRFIYLYEMKNMSDELYRTLLRLLMDLYDSIGHKDEEDMKNMTSGERQSYNDAMVSLSNTIDEIREFQSNLKAFEEYIEHGENL